MQAVVETLDGLERRVGLVLSLDEVEKDVQAQLKAVARKTRIQGFRPGKAPLAMVARTHGPGIRYDVIGKHIDRKFQQVVQDAKLRIVSNPRIEAAQPQSPETAAGDEPQGTLAFSATFEVYPEVTVPDLGTLQVKRVHTTVTDAHVQQAIDMLRKQRTTYQTVQRAAQDEDRIQLDFDGTIDGQPFSGGKAEDFHLVLGQGRMLAEFETAVRGMQAGESKTFPVTFPQDYHGREVAGKTAQFQVTVKDVAEPILPEFDAEFAKALGQAEGDLDKLRADIRANLEREVTARSRMRTKQSVMDALAQATQFELPKALVENDIQARVAAAREDLASRGVPNADTIELPQDLFRAESERRVRLGLVVRELIQQTDLRVQPQQLRERLEEMAQSYDQPQQVVAYYLGDRNRRAEIEAMVQEDNVVEHILSKAQVTEEDPGFDALMGTNAGNA